MANITYLVRLKKGLSYTAPLEFAQQRFDRGTTVPVSDPKLIEHLRLKGQRFAFAKIEETLPEEDEVIKVSGKEAQRLKEQADKAAESAKSTAIKPEVKTKTSDEK